MFQRVGAAAYRADLGNITELCNILGNPQQGLKCIHVAGTNGKGSVTHIIASVLQAQGYKVGIFVSPHYKDYRERIKINGQLISKPFVTKFVAENQERFKQVNASFFEISTAMAFAYFKAKKIDYAIIETGMGGRLDSTNIITPILSVITNISNDHAQFLGDTIAKIAVEKAGIIKPGVPVVIGETQVDTRPVFDAKAKELNCNIIFADKQRKIIYTSDLVGPYQSKNIQTAITAIKALQQQGVVIGETAIKSGLKNVCTNTNFIGRWMLMGKRPVIIFDSAHNEGGLKELKKGLKSLNYKQLHFVYGTVADKDISTILGLLPKQATYYFCKANIPRGLSAIELQEKASAHKLKGESYRSVKAAYKAALSNASAGDAVLVSGSVFVVAEVL